MHIQFDSKNKNEVLAAKAALDHLASTLQPQEVMNGVAQSAPSPESESIAPVRVELPGGSQKNKPFVSRNRESVVFEKRTSQNERKKYPGLYKLSILTLEWMDKGKLYTLGEVADYMLTIGHPKTSGSAVLTHLVKKGYVERPMKAMYKRLI